MNPIKQTVSFVVFFLAQIILLQNVVLFDVAFCFLYLAALLLLPLETNRIATMALGFALGLGIDIFHDTLGIHASACVLMMFARPLITGFLRPSGGYEGNVHPSLHNLGFNWFAPYALLMIFLHHTTLFLIEASRLSLLGHSLLKSLFSTILTFTVLLLVQYLFYKKQRNYY